VAYNIKTNHLVIYDNKAFASQANVGKASAIDPAVRLAPNLDAMIAHVKSLAELPARDRILDLLGKTRASVTNKGVKLPDNVQIAVSNFGGNSQDITKGLRERGVTTIEMSKAPPLPARRAYINRQTIPPMARMMPRPAGVTAYNMRRNTVGGFAQALNMAVQAGGEASIKFHIEDELQRLAPAIAEAMAGGGGALLVITIAVDRNSGVRSFRYASFLAHSNSDGDEAITAWHGKPRMEANPAPHVAVEREYIWIAPPKTQ
jgi:hypothetical protein